MALNVLLFVGSVREGRMAERVAKMVQNYLAKENVNLTVFDPLTKPHLQTVNQPVHFYRDNPPAELVADNEVVKNSDAYVIVCGEYNRCIPPVLASMMDHFPPQSFYAKPVAAVTYSMGRLGGVCSAIQLREFVTELAMVPMQSDVNIGVVQDAINEAGELQSTAFDSSLKRTFDQMIWFAEVLKTARGSDKPFPF